MSQADDLFDQACATLKSPLDDAGMQAVAGKLDSASCQYVIEGNPEGVAKALAKESDVWRDLAEGVRNVAFAAPRPEGKGGSSELFLKAATYFEEAGRTKSLAAQWLIAAYAANARIASLHFLDDAVTTYTQAGENYALASASYKHAAQADRSVGTKGEVNEAQREDGMADAALNLKDKMYEEANKVLRARSEIRRLTGK